VLSEKLFSEFLLGGVNHFPPFYISLYGPYREGEISGPFHCLWPPGVSGASHCEASAPRRVQTGACNPADEGNISNGRCAPDKISLGRDARRRARPGSMKKICVCMLSDTQTIDYYSDGECECIS
jgi:hypothetical protein